MEDAPTLLKIPKSECPDIRTSLPEHNWPKSWSSIEDPVVPLGRNLYGHPLAGLLWERQCEKVLLEYGWEKFVNWNVFVNRARGLFLSVYVDDIKLAGVALKENVRLARILWIVMEVCTNRGFLLGLQKNCQKQKPR